ncbi:GyrI-like domain-containing protein [Chitiniphilus eburneus]|uniref:AraC family transcriptional regulator n=1 Tax=Chitiniphilus eburneus TaxID=2571148 RepID=A0A4U0PHK2_9NEIS|nr:GyrI-like domain-containing protein [Chitiniphilus eburneus]TJZ67456.1 AraC family transcriptional regulator [Chitiniphilus eburneus]
MNVEIRTRPATHLVGIALKTSLRDERNLREIPAFWRQLSQDGALFRLAEGAPIYGAVIEFDPSSRDFTYLAGFEHPVAQPLPQGMQPCELPAGRYAVLTTTPTPPENCGAEIAASWFHLHRTWLPASGYLRGAGPEFERYDERFHPQRALVELELWLPLGEE